MSEDLHKYIRQAQGGGADHQTIKDRLVGAGWHPKTVSQALEQHDDTHRKPAPGLGDDKAQTPVAVVQALSTRGVEYYLMVIALAFSAVSLWMILQSIAEYLLGETNAMSVFGASIMSLASSALVVSLPLFIFFYLRLKKAELRTPSLLLDPSRRRALQILLITTFVVGIISAMLYVFAFFSLSYDTFDTQAMPISLLIAEFVITLLLVGGVFAAYWMETHKKTTGQIKLHYIAMAILAALSLGAVIWHYVLARGTAGDERKADDLTSLQVAIDQYAIEHTELPTSLGALQLQGPVAKHLNDYEYSHTTDSFTLCATFATKAYIPGDTYDSEDSPYTHQKGRQCFTWDLANYEDPYYLEPLPATPTTDPTFYDLPSFQ